MQNQKATRTTLAEIRKNDLKKRDFRPSDFLSEEEQLDLRKANYQGRRKEKRFDEIDAYAAEIVARFGYGFYKDWCAGQITTEKVNRFIAAERAREKGQILATEALLGLIVSATSHKIKGKPAPRAPKLAVEIFKKEEKIAKGEF